MNIRDGRLTGVTWPDTHEDAELLAVLVDIAGNHKLPPTHHTHPTLDCDEQTREVLLALVRAYVSRTATDDDLGYYAWIAACRHRDALATSAPQPVRVEPRQLSLFGGAL